MAIFDWFKSKSTVDDSAKTSYKRSTPPQVDFTDAIRANTALTKGIYNNTYPGFKLAGFGFNIINVPCSFMGLPVVEVADNEAMQDYLNDLIVQFSKQIRSIHTQCHRDGTLWVYPKYDSTNGLIWDLIADDAVYKIIRDIKTKEIIKLITKEEISVNEDGTDNVLTITKQVTYTKDKVVTEYTGSQMVNGLRNSSTVNPARTLPIPFSNNADVDEVRGHSDFEKILSDLKNYHDIDLAESTALAKFATKMVQTVKNFEDWIDKNFAGNLTAFSQLNINTIDFIVNMEGDKTEFIHPSGMVDGYEKKLKTIFHKLVELSGIPEIAWGLKTEGNLASVEENMAILMQYVKDKQEQKIEPYTDLFYACMNLLSAAMVIPQFEGEIVVTWDVMDATSEATRAEIFQKFADALSKLIGAAGITKEQLYRLWKYQYPSITEEEIEQFSEGLLTMANHVVRLKASPMDLLDAQGLIDQ